MSWTPYRGPPSTVPPLKLPFAFCEILYETLQCADFSSEIMPEIPFPRASISKNFPGRECPGPLTEDYLLLSPSQTSFCEIVYETLQCADFASEIMPEITSPRASIVKIFQEGNVLDPLQRTTFCYPLLESRSLKSCMHPRYSLS